jgi:F-type H+-transporting ATPase subunit gamma
MERLTTIKRKIGTTEELHTVVSTMKALAAVNVRLFERAEDAAARYLSIVRRAFNVVLRSAPELRLPEPYYAERTAGIIVIGSDQGMCGQFNEHIVSFTRGRIAELHDTYQHLPAVAVGYRVVHPLREIGVAPEVELSVPSSVSGLSSLVEELLDAIGLLRDEHDAEQIHVFYNRQRGKASYYSVDATILPTQREWFEELLSTDWPTNQIPMHSTEPERMFRFLVEQYLFIELYTAVSASLAAENASRLNAMQSAEQNVDERLEELTDLYNRQRQAEITGEMLDIVSGYEAINS